MISMCLSLIEPPEDGRPLVLHPRDTFEALSAQEHLKCHAGWRNRPQRLAA